MEKGEESDANSAKRNKFQQLVGGFFIVGVAGVSLLAGFSTTLAMAKKKDPSTFAKGLTGSRELPESGGQLAIRALGRGTLYAISGVGLFCLAVWKLMGVKNMEEFRLKIQKNIPQAPKKEPEGRSDFSTVREVVNYLIEEDARQKQIKTDQRT